MRFKNIKIKVKYIKIISSNYIEAGVVQSV
jgi:hypothetical protein